MSQFIPTRQGNPCCLCENTTGKCRQVEALHLCMTFTDQHTTVPDLRFIGRTKDDRWGKWREDDGQAWSETQREQWRREQQQRKVSQAHAEAQRHAASLSAVERGIYYKQLLEQLSLNPIDRSDLLRRGLSEEQIQAWGVKSVEQGQKLERPLPCTLPGVDQSGNSLTVAGGYLCPIRDVDGWLVSYQVRFRDAEPGDRYRWCTSRADWRPDGPIAHSPNGELPLAIHRPAYIQRQAIALVEGTGAKPFRLCQSRGQVVVGAVGGSLPAVPKPSNTRWRYSRLN